MKKRFSARKVVVTGAGQGIGYDICKRFAQEGATVGLNDLDPQLCGQACEAINEAIGERRVFPLPADVADARHIQEAIQQFARQQQGLDVLVANAGITNFGAFMEARPEEFDRLMAVNMRGTYFSVQAAAREMLASSKGGRILLMSSVCGVQAHLNLSAYSMTKAAIRMLAKCLAIELGPHGITVNALGPGATLTARTRGIDPQYERGWEAVTPNRRVGQVEDISAVACFLASDEARHINGEILMIDGGWTIYSPLPEEGSGA